MWPQSTVICRSVAGDTLTTGGTQKRYTVNGVIDTAASPIDNLNALVAAMAGAVTYVQGKFRGYAGSYDAPAGTIDLSKVVDKIKVRARTPRNELFNRVQGTFVDPAKNYQPTYFPPVKNSLYEAQDGGEAIARDIVLTLTNHPEAAQRIGKVLLEQGRQGIQVELKLNHTALEFAVWDTVQFTNAPLGWADKVFRIKNLSTDGVGPITVTLQEESSASYDWAAGQASTYDAAPDTNLPSPFYVAPPVSLTVEEDLYVTREGDGVKAKATMNWVASPDAFIYLYQPEYKLSTDTVWSLLPRTTGTTSEVLDIAPAIYNFRVKAINTLNASSVYEQTTKQISGLAAPPTAPQSLYWSAIGGLAYLNWAPSPDLDVRIGGKYVFRYSPDTSDGWANSTSIGNAVPGGTSQAVLPLKPGIYLVKAEDSSGVQSTTASSVIVTQDTIYALSVISTLTEDPTFGGTKTNCTVSGGVLKLTDTTLPGTGVYAVSVTGTTTITSFGSGASTSNPLYFVRFTGALTLTHNATSLILPGGANLALSAGAAIVALYLGSGNWRVPFVQNGIGSTGVPPSASASTSSPLTFSCNAGSFTDITGLTGVSLTPGSASQKVHLSGAIHVGSASNVYVRIQILRGTTVIYSASQFIYNAAYAVSIPVALVDSPATTSPVTYSAQISVGSGTGITTYVNRDNAGTSEAFTSSLNAVLVS